VVKIADDFTGSSKPSNDTGGKPSAASQLVEMALDRYHFSVTEDGQPYAIRTGRHVVRMLRGGKNSLRAELSQAYYQRHKKAAPQQALADALLVLEGMAQDQDPGRVHLRVAKANGVVWLDMGDAAETVIKIDRDGWQIVAGGVPLLFRRTALTGAIPDLPAGLAGVAGMKNGQSQDDVHQLWDHINVAPADRPLLLAWLIAALIAPEAPHPILALFGEQGTGKSTTSRRIVATVDPSPVPLRKPPRDPEGWVTAAQGSWVVRLDNLSQVPDWLSDCLCRAATGDGDVRRALYTDSDLAVFAFRRCIPLNGIDVGALRGDLADRIVMINLDRIDEERRTDEEELEQKWEAAYPDILGGLFAVAAGVMGLLPSVRLASKPRMADFARIVAAIDQLLGTKGLGRYTEQARSMAEDSLSADPLIARMKEVQLDFIGKASELLTKITPDSDRWRPPKNWPKEPRAVTSILKRNAPALRKTGWVVEEGEDTHDKIVIWTLIHPEKVRNRDPQHPQNSQEIGRKSGPQGPQGAKSDDACTVCAGPLLAPHSQQRGICEKCWLRMPDDEARSA